jgi:peptide/nickel transport system permease protein
MSASGTPAAGGPLAWAARLGALLPFRGTPFFAILVLRIVLVAALAGETITPHDPNELDLAGAFRPPAWQSGGRFSYFLGTDNLGRDLVSRILMGCRISLLVAGYAIALSGSLGALVGMISGYFGGRIDAVIMRLVDIQMSIPALALALMLAAVLGPGLNTVVTVIVLTYWTWYARIIRSEILSLKEREYVAFARIAGVGTATIFRRHLLPNVLNTLLVLATLQIGQVILFEASLSFLGLGIQPPDVSWGVMLADARQ